MKLLDHLLLIIFTGNLKPLIKGLSRAEYFRQQEVEEGPKLMKIILPCRKSDKQIKRNIKKHMSHGIYNPNQEYMHFTQTALPTKNLPAMEYQ
jgi:hypothetical protein